MKRTTAQAQPTGSHERPVSYSTKQVAAMRGLTEKNVLIAIWSGRLKAHKYGSRTIKVMADDYDAWVEASVMQPKPAFMDAERTEPEAVSSVETE